MTDGSILANVRCKKTEENRTMNDFIMRNLDVMLSIKLILCSARTYNNNNNNARGGKRERREDEYVCVVY